MSNKECDTYKNEVENECLVEKIKKLEHENNLMKEALKYFSDNNNWRKVSFYDMNPYDISYHLIPDPEVARKVLSIIEDDCDKC